MIHECVGVDLGGGGASIYIYIYIYVGGQVCAYTGIQVHVCVCMYM